MWRNELLLLVVAVRQSPTDSPFQDSDSRGRPPNATVRGCRARRESGTSLRDPAVGTRPERDPENMDGMRKMKRINEENLSLICQNTDQTIKRRLE